jgi:GTP cyclohydrolase IB
MLKPASATTPTTAESNLPDAQIASGAYGALDWVGMENIAVPINLSDQRVFGYADIAVDLRDANVRGIHMSRLYLLLDKALTERTLCPDLIHQLLRDALKSQINLSTQAKLTLRFERVLRRPALASGNSGWRAYPIVISAHLNPNGHLRLSTALQITYSSTCPSSAALARQKLQQRFSENFADPTNALERSQVFAWLGTAEGGSAATPHAQRSTLDVEITLTANAVEFPWLHLIDALEHTLQTPVQTAVKRVDEQAFATRNGANLMFVEDALRRVRVTLENLAQAQPPIFSAYNARVKHLESLHAHDAVASIWRN